jgi:hypothetical protein
MLQCLLALCLLGGQFKHSQILKFSIAPCQIYTLLGGQFKHSQILKFSIAPCQIYTLLGGQFKTFTNSQILNCTLPNLQLHIATSPIFTSPLLHCKRDKFTLFYGLPKIFGLPPLQNPLIAQFIYLFIFDQTLFFWAVFFFWGEWGGLY